MADPLHQFQVTPLPGLDFGEVTLPLVGTVHLAFTNSHLAMTIAFVALGLLTHWLHGLLGTQGLLIAAASVFVLAWIAQFIGHNIEGKRPSFLTDLVYLLIGPLWLMSKLFRRLGLGY